MKEELLKGLTEEQIAKLKACKNSDEMLAIASEEGVELSEEQLEVVNGGSACDTHTECPKCGSTNVKSESWHHTGPRYDNQYWKCFCNDCGSSWTC